MKLRVMALSAIVILLPASTAMSQVPQAVPARQPLPAPRPAAQVPSTVGPQEPGPRPDPQGPPRGFGPHEPAPAARPDGQTPQPGIPRAAQAPDPIGENLFPPELVMQHKQELALTDEQKAYLKTEAIAASTHFNQLQWQMQEEVEAMIDLMKGTTIDEQRVLAQMDKILGLEREVKHTQMRLAIRIKNKLTPDQQMKLQEFRRHPVPPR